MKPFILLSATAIVFVTGCTTTHDGPRGATVHHADYTQYTPLVDTTGILPPQIPYKGSIVPDTTLQLTPGFGISLEKLVYWGAFAAAAYLIVDPLSPNWSIEQAAFPENHVHLSLQMKRYYAGGAGEARQVFHRRAKQLARESGFAGYDVVEYSEGIDSSVIGSKRVAEGVIRLRQKIG